MNETGGAKVLEVIATSLEDAIEAERGGAGRIELVRALVMGGFTPDLKLPPAIAGAVKIPLRVMLRESDSSSVLDGHEFSGLEEAVGRLSHVALEGVVFGFVRKGAIEVKLVEQLLGRLPSHWRVTFHRAFESVTDPFEAIEVLKQYPQIDHILTHGANSEDAFERRKELEALQVAAGERLTIIAAGGPDLNKLRVLAASPILRELHVGRAARLPATHLGPVRRERVAAVKQLLEAAPGATQPTAG